MEQLPKKTGTGRKRRPEAKNFTLRLTDGERRSLQERAGQVPLGIYIRGLILGADVRQRRYATPLKDNAALAQVLAMLGQSRLSNNLNQLAKLAHIGALPMTVETETEIREACRAVSSMRCDLMRALGLADGMDA